LKWNGEAVGADKSALGAINRPLHCSFVYKYFVHPVWFVSLTSLTLAAYTTCITIVLIGWPGVQAE